MRISNDADVTMMRIPQQEIPEGIYPVKAGHGSVLCTRHERRPRQQDLHQPDRRGGDNFSMNVYVVEREFLIRMIDDAYVHGHTYFVRDLLDKQIDRLDIRGFCYDGYVVNIHDTQSYFEENMRLLQEENLNALFSPNQIYTKIRDDNPTRYINGSKAKNVMVADGCVIEGSRKQRPVSRRSRWKRRKSEKLCTDAGYRSGR